MIIPLPHSDFFCGKFSGLAQIFWAAVAIHFAPPPPKQTPWRRSWDEGLSAPPSKYQVFNQFLLQWVFA